MFSNELRVRGTAALCGQDRWDVLFLHDGQETRSSCTSANPRHDPPGVEVLATLHWTGSGCHEDWSRCQQHVQPLSGRSLLLSGYVSQSVTQSVCQSVRQSVNEWVSEWVSECVSVWVMSKLLLSGYVSQSPSQSVSPFVSQWMSEWVSECVSVWVMSK